MRQKILMCRPDYFGVHYVINPWMERQQGRTDAALAHQQWQALYDLIAARAEVALIPPVRGLPDMVFTANAGLVQGTKALTSSFHAPERQGESVYFADWFAAHGFTALTLPAGISFEGAGDALFDRGTARLWAGYGFRGDGTATRLLQDLFRADVVGLRLIDPRFYHLDTCFCPLSGGYTLIYLPAFDAASQTEICRRIAPAKLITISETDALSFACNAVELDGAVIMNNATPALQARLHQAGFTPLIAPLSEFMKAGGAAKCLTLKLVE